MYIHTQLCIHIMHWDGLYMYVHTYIHTYTYIHYAHRHALVHPKSGPGEGREPLIPKMVTLKGCLSVSFVSPLPSLVRCGFVP